MNQGFPYITIVDDDPDDREFLLAAMQRCFPNVAVLAFDKVSELLVYLHNCKDEELPVAMILDYKMPGTTGAEVLRITGKDTPYSAIRKVVWSTSRLRKEMDECLALGAFRWIIKPDTDNELDLAIRSLAPMFFKVLTAPSAF
ncbi:MAG TPA: response regulator [Puia sp.]|nr:response regulator [Puia sp.]